MRVKLSLSLLCLSAAMYLLPPCANAEDPFENPILQILNQADRQGLVKLKKPEQGENSADSMSEKTEITSAPETQAVITQCVDIKRLSEKRYQSLQTYQDIMPFRESYASLPDAANRENLAYAYAALGLARESSAVLGLGLEETPHGLTYLTRAIGDQTAGSYAALPENIFCEEPGPLWSYLTGRIELSRHSEFSESESIAHNLDIISKIEALPVVLRKMVFRQLAVVAAQNENFALVELLERRFHIPSRRSTAFPATDHQLFYIYALSETQTDKKKLWLDYLIEREGLFQLSAVKYARQKEAGLTPITPEIYQSLSQTHGAADQDEDVDSLLVSEYLAQQKFHAAGSHIMQQMTPGTPDYNAAREQLAVRLIGGLGNSDDTARLSALSAGYTFKSMLEGSERWPDLRPAMMNAAAGLGLNEIVLSLFSDAPEVASLTPQTRTLVIKSYIQNAQNWPAQWEESLDEPHYWELFTAHMLQKDFKSAANLAGKFTRSPYKEDAALQLHINWRDWKKADASDAQAAQIPREAEIRAGAITLIAAKPTRLFQQTGNEQGYWSTYQSGLNTLNAEIQSAEAYLLYE